jgi:hypothetical protein
MRLKISIVFSYLLAQGAQSLGIVLVHLLLPFFILPKLKRQERKNIDLRLNSTVFPLFFKGEGAQHWSQDLAPARHKFYYLSHIPNPPDFQFVTFFFLGVVLFLKAISIS